jgi:hypothetical protein
MAGGRAGRRYLVDLAVLCDRWRGRDGDDQRNADPVQYAHPVLRSAGHWRSVARQRDPSDGRRHDLLQTHQHSMSFGVALQNAISLGLGGIISLVTGGSSAGVVTVEGSILLEDNVSILLMEDNVSEILGEG